jgi:predicted Zn-dependent protease
MDPGPLIRQLVRQYGLISPFSRSCEKEADHIGLLLMAKACYDPEAAIRVWTRMKNLGSKQPLEYLSTHPSNDTRIKMIADWLPEAKQVGVEAGCSFVKALPYKRFG